MPTAALDRCVKRLPVIHHVLLGAFLVTWLFALVPSAAIAKDSYEQQVQQMYIANPDGPLRGLTRTHAHRLRHVQMLT